MEIDIYQWILGVEMRNEKSDSQIRIPVDIVIFTDVQITLVKV